jgi:hypothetical protein
MSCMKELFELQGVLPTKCPLIPARTAYHTEVHYAIHGANIEIY